MKKLLTIVLISFALVHSALAKTYHLGIYTDILSLKRSHHQFMDKVLTDLNSMNKTGDNYKLVTYQNPRDLAKALAEGTIEIAYGKLETYFLAKRLNSQIKIVAVPYQGEQEMTFSIYLVTLKTNPAIKSWQDLQGKSFIFKNKYSVAGYAYPIAYLKQEGKDFRQFFKSYSFAQDNENILQDIMGGKKGDAGAVWDEVYTHSTIKDKFKTLHEIKKIPNPPLIGNSKLTSDDINKIQKDFSQIPAETLASFYISGFTATVPEGLYDDAYSVIRTAAEVDPSFNDMIVSQ